MPKHWIPLESNPEVLDELASKLGVANIPTAFRFADVFGLDADLLAMLPQPVLAVLLLFPITKQTEAVRKDEQRDMEASGAPAPPPSLYYMKQTIGNACGTIGLLHCVLNTAAAARGLQLAPTSFLEHFLAATLNLSPQARGAFLENPPEGATSIDSIHEEAAQQGATAPTPADADVDLHFVAFVEKTGRLWELDGRKAGPIDHGATSSGSLLADVASVVRRNFVEKADSSLNFSLIALAAAEGDS